MIKHFRDLAVWQKADALAHQVFSLTDTFPRQYLFDLVNQLRRAALSVPTNLAEGYATIHTKELLQFINIAHRSVSETQYLLLFASRRQLVTAPVYEPLVNGYEEVHRMLNGLSTALRQRRLLTLRRNGARGLTAALTFFLVFTGHWSPVTSHQSLAYAQVPQLIRYQGQALDNQAVPLEGP